MRYEFKDSLEIIQGYELDILRDIKTSLDPFLFILKEPRIVVAVVIKCPKTDCNGHGVFSAEDTIRKEINCDVCGLRIDSKNHRNRIMKGESYE